MICGNPHADVGSDMLPFTQGDLELGQDIPIRPGTFSQIAIGEEFRHGGPHPPEAAVGLNRFPQRSSPEGGTGKVPGAGRELHTRLYLNKAVARQRLTEGAKSFKQSYAITKAAISIARWQRDFALRAQNSSGPQALSEDPFHADANISNPAIPVP